MASEKLGEIYLNTGELEKAEKLFKTSLNLSPENELQYNYHMGRLALSRNDNAAAEEYFIKMTELAPDDPAGYFLLGRIYIIRAGVENNSEFYTVAIDYLEKSSKLPGAVPEAYLMLGIAYTELGDIPKAKMYAEEAIKRGIQGNGIIDAKSILNKR